MTTTKDDIIRLKTRTDVPDEILSHMEDIKYKAPVPPAKPRSSTNSNVTNNRSNGLAKVNGHSKYPKPCPHTQEYEIKDRADTHPHVPHPHPLNLDEHTTSNTLFPTPSPPAIKTQQRPISPAMQKKREVFKSPFDPETKSDQMKKFGINDSNDDFKFNSYHLDYKYTPPPIKGPCVVCGEGIIGPLVTALDSMFHPEHFCCANCDRELRPPYFLEHDGDPYCKACHNKLFLPPCAACGKHIPDKYISAFGKVYHPECHVCTKCGIMLPEKDFKSMNGKPYCERDYNDLFLPKCAKCSKPITDGKKTDALGRTFHPSCFRCTKCNCVLNPNNFYEKNGLPYCENDYNDLFMPKCAGCNLPITKSPMQVMGKPWHPGCFRCTECSKQLSPNNFFEKNGLPYCEKDFHNKFSPKCAGCKAPIKDNPMNARNQLWHPRCFTCNACEKPLSPNNYSVKEGIPGQFCEDCFHAKFSPKCAGCKNPIRDNPLNARNAFWHPRCFTCNVCNKQLTPNNFFVKEGQPGQYCEDDYHNKFSPKCFNCNGPIKETPTFAMGKPWHDKCFKCTECRKQLTPSNFMEKGGMPYCVDDYHRLFSPKCYSCNKPITDGKPLVAHGRNYHQGCFSCEDCGSHLSPTNFYEREGRILCEEDYHRRFSPKCSQCYEPIKNKQAVFALGKNFHPQCFRCVECNKQLAENAFYENDGLPYCEDDYMRLFAPKCQGCTRPITDSFCYTWKGDWHQACFRCKDCNIPLEDTNFYEFEGDGPFCERHWHERMCPDCIKMRRALAQYCGKTNTTLAKPPLGHSNTQAIKFTSHTSASHTTSHLPPRPSSRQSQASPDTHQKVTFHDIQASHSQSHHQSSNKLPAVRINDERPTSSQSQYSIESTYNEHRNGNGTYSNNISPYPGSDRSEYSTWAPLQSSSNGLWGGHVSANAVDKTSSHNSGKFPVGNNMYQFETSFKKEEYQSISRH